MASKNRAVFTATDMKMLLELSQGQSEKDIQEYYKILSARGYSPDFPSSKDDLSVKRKMVQSDFTKRKELWDEAPDKPLLISSERNKATEKKSVKASPEIVTDEQGGLSSALKELSDYAYPLTWEFYGYPKNLLREITQLDSRIAKRPTRRIFRDNLPRVPNYEREEAEAYRQAFKTGIGDDFSQSLFDQYWLGKGDRTLTDSEFAGIMKTQKGKGGKFIWDYAQNEDGTPIAPHHFQNGGKDYAAYKMSFYDTEYNNSLGDVWVTFEMGENGPNMDRPVGFHDRFDFNAKPLGSRTLKSEFLTWLARTKSEKHAPQRRDFNIRYGVTADQYP